MNPKNRLVLAALLLFATLPLTAAAQFVVAHTVDGSQINDRTGFSVSGAGDVNKDGFDDVIIGTPNGDNNGPDSGRAVVISGKDGSTLYTFVGDSAFDLFGHAVAGAGDLNGDGYDDVIVGIPLDDNNGLNSGAARVFSGIDGSVMTTLNGAAAGDFFGLSVDGAGDVNGDGTVDLIVGALYNSTAVIRGGMARVFSGVDFSILNEFLGNFAFQSLGAFVSGAGDTNNDGFDDVILGSPFYGAIANDGGKAELRSGADGSLLFQWFGAGNKDFFGTCVDGGMDVNDDGFDDIVVGAPGNETGPLTPGFASVYSGFDGSTLHTFTGSMPGSRLGYAVAFAGDINNDGHADILIGSNRDDSQALNAGRIEIYSGLDGSVLYQLDGALAGNELGYSVAAAGDVNRDGFPDIVVGAAFEDTSAVDGGRAYVITSPALPVLHYSTTVIAEPIMTLSWVGAGGDVNATSGTMTCTGASVFGLGVAGISLAPGEFTLFGMPYLIAVDSINLIETPLFGFDATGTLVVPGVTRINPFIAGSLIHVQCFEYFPVISSSTGVRLRIDP